MPKSRVPGWTPSCGSVTPMPVRALVRLPPSLEKITWFVNAPALGGVKRTVMLVEAKPAMLNEAGETSENGPGPRLTVPFVKAAEPELVRLKLARAFDPTATVPKSSTGGAAES